MIRIGLPLSLVAVLAGTTALSQEPTTAITEATAAPQVCETWDVGFEFSSCNRMEWPGGDGGFQQIYTTHSGERRSFRFDPQASKIAEPGSAVQTAAAERGGSSAPDVPKTIADQIAARKAVTAAPEPRADSSSHEEDEGAPARRRRSSAASVGNEGDGESIAVPTASLSVTEPEGEGDPEPYARDPEGEPVPAAVSPRLPRVPAENRHPNARDRVVVEPRPAQQPARQDETEPPVVVAENFVLPNQITIIPGRTELMPMAIGHLNRIETPFSDPMVRTSAAADALNVEFDQNYVYVALTQAVTLFIHERGHPDPAIVVALIPEQIAPRQVRINVPPTIADRIKKQAPKATKASSDGKPSGPRANSNGVTREDPAGLGQRSAKAIRDLRTFSEGRMPRGYQPGNIANYTAASFCNSLRGVSFTFQQGAMIYDGTNFIVRGMATTRSAKPIELSEQSCMNAPGSLAAGFFPRTQISKDSPTDFYVIVTRPELLTSSTSTKGGSDG